MHLNERLEKSREAIGQQLAVGQQKVSSAYNRLWAEMEAMREAQKKRQEEQRLAAEKEGKPIPDVSHAQANIQAASKSAGAYFSSWGTWASEKRKGWGANKTPVSSPSPVDVKRAEDFRRDKEGVVGGEEEKELADMEEGKRSSVFFDAEKDASGRGAEGKV
jgi:hypothetical protein